MKLKEEMKRGQELEDQLFKAREEVHISPKQLQLLRHTHTIAQLKTKYYSKSKKRVRFMSVAEKILIQYLQNPVPH